MNKKEFVELALRACKPEVFDAKAYFENLYDQTFKEIEERIAKLTNELEEIGRLLEKS